MTVEMYTQDEVDQIVAGLYSKDDVDALLEGLQAQIDGIKSPNPPVVPPPTGKIIGSGDMTAFKGLKISGHRTYNGFGVQRQYNPTLALANVKADLAAGRKSYFSIGAGNNKAHPGGPQDWPTTLTGLPVESFVPAVKVVKQNGGTLIIHHEPEDDPGTPANYRIWFGLMADYYRQQVPGIRIGLCLMAWSGRKGGPGFQRFTPDTTKWDVFCIDGYAHGLGDDAADLFANSLAYARSLKKPMMICETGQENNVDQVPYLNSLNQFVQANNDVEGFLYWNGGNGVQSKGGHNYHLSDSGLGVYAGLVNGGKYAQSKSPV